MESMLSNRCLYLIHHITLIILFGGGVIMIIVGGICAFGGTPTYCASMIKDTGLGSGGLGIFAAGLSLDILIILYSLIMYYCVIRENADLTEG